MAKVTRTLSFDISVNAPLYTAINQYGPAAAELIGQCSTLRGSKINTKYYINSERFAYLAATAIAAPDAFLKLVEGKQADIPAKLVNTFAFFIKDFGITLARKKGQIKRSLFANVDFDCFEYKESNIMLLLHVLVDVSKNFFLNHNQDYFRAVLAFIKFISNGSIPADWAHEVLFKAFDFNMTDGPMMYSPIVEDDVETEEAGKEPAAPKALGFVPAMPTLPKLCSPAICEPVGTQFIPAGRLNSLLYRDNNGKIFADVREVVFAAIDLTGGMGAFLRCESDIRDYLNEINEHEAMIALRSCLYDYAIDGYNSKTLEKVRIVAASDAYQAFNKFFNGIKNTFELFAIKHGMSAAATQQAIKSLAALNETLEYAAKNSPNTVYFYSVFSNEFAEWKVFTWNSTLYRKTLGFIPAMPTLPKMAHVEVEAAAPVETNTKAAPSTTTKGSNAALIMRRLNDAVAHSPMMQRSFAAMAAKTTPKNDIAPLPLRPFGLGVYEYDTACFGIDLSDTIDVVEYYFLSNHKEYSSKDFERLFERLEALETSDKSMAITAQAFKHSRLDPNAINIVDVSLTPVAKAKAALESITDKILECVASVATYYDFDYDYESHMVEAQLSQWAERIDILLKPVDHYALTPEQATSLIEGLAHNGRRKAGPKTQRFASSQRRQEPKECKLTLYDAARIARSYRLNLGSCTYLFGLSKEPIIYHYGKNGPVLSIAVLTQTLLKALNHVASDFVAKTVYNRARHLLNVMSRQDGLDYYVSLDALVNGGLAKTAVSCAYVGALSAYAEGMERPNRVPEAIQAIFCACSALITIFIYDNYWNWCYNPLTKRHEFQPHTCALNAA